MAAYYEGRDLLRTEDIYGTQSATAVKHRNIDQEQYVPVVIKNVPDVYQRQAELHKNIRNPHYNDYRYDMKQEHPQFVPNSYSTKYRDSLDDFKQQQETIKNDILKNNSLINYDFIRMQKNKNSYEKLNPPFANLHSEINERQAQYNSLKSPMQQYLQSNLSNGFQRTNNSTQGNHKYAVASVNQSPLRAENNSQKNLINRSSSQASMNPAMNYSSVNNSNSIFKPEEQSPINRSQPSLSIQQQQQQIQQVPQQQMSGSPVAQNNNAMYKSAQPQMPNSPTNNHHYQDSVLGELQSQQQYQQNHNQQPSAQPQHTLNGSQSIDYLTQSSTISNKKTYKPYNIIIHNSYIPYTPKFDLPEITWDKYDRQMFRNFDKKAMPPVEIIKNKNDQMNTFNDYTTWNQKYGEAR